MSSFRAAIKTVLSWLLKSMTRLRQYPRSKWSRRAGTVAANFPRAEQSSTAAWCRTGWGAPAIRGRRRAKLHTQWLKKAVIRRQRSRLTTIKRLLRRTCGNTNSQMCPYRVEHTEATIKATSWPLNLPSRVRCRGFLPSERMSRRQSCKPVSSMTHRSSTCHLDGRRRLDSNSSTAQFKSRWRPRRPLL